MESLQVLIYKYQTGGCNLLDLIQMVDNKKITEEEFFEITRYNYKYKKMALLN